VYIPNLGICCPRLCRKLGLVLAFIVFGLVAGARSVAVFMADPDPDPMHAMALAPAEALDSATSSLPTTTVETKAVEATLAQKTTKVGGFKSSCRESITEQLGSDCTSGKARKPRSRQAVNERPAMASVLIGHSAGPVVLPSEPEITVDPAVPPSDPEITAAATPNIPDDPAKTEDAAEVAPASIVKGSAAAPLVSIERSRTHSKSVQRRDQDDRKYVRHRDQDDGKYVRHRNQDDRTYVQRRTRNEDSPSPRYSSQNHYQSGYARVW
jgi:hypothetical protein